MKAIGPFAHSALVGALLLGVTACERAPSPDITAETAAAGPSEDTVPAGVLWRSEVSGSGMALILSDATGQPLLRVACARDPAVMSVLAETFQPVGSEERFSLGVDGEVFVFVADPAADRPAGVQAEAPIPDELLDRLAGAREIGATYGSQTLGPYVPPDAETAERFASACRQIANR